MTFPEAGRGTAVAASTDDTPAPGSRWTDPAVLTVLGAGAVALLLALLLLARRRRSRRAAEPTREVLQEGA